MPNAAHQRREAVGKRFSLPAMVKARKELAGEQGVVDPLDHELLKDRLDVMVAGPSSSGIRIFGDQGSDAVVLELKAAIEGVDLLILVGG
jgi:hypothetical protein